MNARSRPRRERLDRLLVERGLAATRAKAQALVLAGRVHAAGQRLDKPGVRVPVDSELVVDPGPRWVGRGGHKLDGALERLGVAVAGRDALDVGASTGGFTEVLLERGAARVIALDVGKGQLDWGLRNHPAVHPLEGVNARYLEPSLLPFPPDLAVIDVSFISLRLVLPPVLRCLPDEGDCVALVKPQFEVGRGEVGRHGIVRRPELHVAVLERLAAFLADGLGSLRAVVPSCLPGAEGNREFFLHLAPTGPGLDPARTARAIEAAVAEATEEEAT